MSQECPICRKAIRVGQMVISVSSPAEVLSASQAFIDYPLNQAMIGEIILHEDCFKQISPELWQLINAKLSDNEDEGNVIVNINPKDYKQPTIMPKELVELLASIGEKITVPEAASFLRRNNHITNESDLIKEYFRQRSG